MRRLWSDQSPIKTLVLGSLGLPDPPHLGMSPKEQFLLLQTFKIGIFLVLMLLSWLLKITWRQLGQWTQPLDNFWTTLWGNFGTTVRQLWHHIVVTKQLLAEHTSALWAAYMAIFRERSWNQFVIKYNPLLGKCQQKCEFDLPGFWSQLASSSQAKSLWSDLLCRSAHFIYYSSHHQWKYTYKSSFPFINIILFTKAIVYWISHC